MFSLKCEISGLGNNLIKFLPCMHEALNLIPRKHIKSLSMMTWPFNPSLEISEMGGSLWLIGPQSSLINELQANEKSSLKESGACPPNYPWAPICKCPQICILAKTKSESSSVITYQHRDIFSMSRSVVIMALQRERQL